MATPQPGSVPFDEAIRFFRAKLNVGTDRWNSIDAQAHAVGFAVAGVRDMDALAAIRVAVDRAIADGTTLDAFRRDLKAVIERTGLQLRGKFAWRSRVIFETNLRAAYAAGKWAQIQATKAEFPLLRYVAVLDNRTRPQHRAWHGTILPVDHPFWRTHFPPNGWGCRCTVQQVSARDLARNRWQVTEPPPSFAPVPRLVRDPGAPGGRRIVEVPPGIDVGWDHNVGMLAAAGPARVDPVGMTHALERVAEKIAAAPTALAAATARALLSGRAFAEWQKAPAGAFPVGVLPEPVRTAIGASQGGVRLSAETMAKQRANHPDLRQADYALIPDILAAPDFAAQEGPPRQTVLVKQVGETFWLVVKTTGDGGQNFVTSFRRADIANLRSLRRRARAVLLGDLEALIARVAADIAARRRRDRPPEDEAG